MNLLTTILTLEFGIFRWQFKVIMSKSFVDIDNARYDDQIQVMERIESADHCPFCEENLKKYHRQPILKKTKYWLVTTNQWPYEHTRWHFLIIYRQHIVKLSQLEPKAGEELFNLISWLEKEYQIPGGGLAMRFGDTNYSAGSVTHLHAQLVMPDLTDKDYQPVRIKIGKSVDQLKNKSRNK